MTHIIYSLSLKIDAPKIDAFSENSRNFQNYKIVWWVLLKFPIFGQNHFQSNYRYRIVLILTKNHGKPDMTVSKSHTRTRRRQITDTGVHRSLLFKWFRYLISLKIFLKCPQNSQISIFGPKNIGKMQSKIAAPKIDTLRLTQFSSFEHY